MFDGLLLFRPLSSILSESVMTEPDTMTYMAQFENLGELVKNTGQRIFLVGKLSFKRIA